MTKRWWIAGYVIALLVVLLAPLASPDPDGLERVAGDQGFIDQAAEAPAYEIIPDYVLPGVDNEALATILAGWVGVTLVFALVAGLAHLARQRSAARDSV